jgi:hypothetical protein
MPEVRRSPRLPPQARSHHVDEPEDRPAVLVAAGWIAVASCLAGRNFVSWSLRACNTRARALRKQRPLGDLLVKPLDGLAFSRSYASAILAAFVIACVDARRSRQDESRSERQADAGEKIGPAMSARPAPETTRALCPASVRKESPSSKMLGRGMSKSYRARSML